jgi:hypothetical protein
LLQGQRPGGDGSRRQLQPDIKVTKLSISQRLKMGPVIATEGKSHQTKKYTHC